MDGWIGEYHLGAMGGLYLVTDLASDLTIAVLFHIY